MLKTRFLPKIQRIEAGFSRKKTGFCDFLGLVQDLSLSIVVTPSGAIAVKQT
jgi:hypothetical protein